MEIWAKRILIASAVALVFVLSAMLRLSWIASAPEPISAPARIQAPQPKLASSADASSKEKDGAKESVTDEVLTDADADELIELLSQLAEAEGAVPGELLLRFHSAEALARFRQRLRAIGAELLFEDARLKAARIKYQDPKRMAAELRDHADDYENIAPNVYVYVPGLPAESEVTDAVQTGGRVPFESSGLDMIGAVGDRSRWGAGVKVAVIDTGITEHPDLAGVRVSHVDLVPKSKMNGHGTAMATLIAGKDPQYGGVAPATELLDVRVADESGSSNAGLVAEGILRALDAGARVINVSMAADSDSAVLREAVNYALARGAVVVASAGNEKAKQLAYPAAYEGVISVGSVDAEGQPAYFSNSGEGLTLTAPGVGIVSGYTGSGRVVGSGTSQSAALVSGSVAALLSRQYNPNQVMTLLNRHAIPVQAPRSQVGAGILRLP